MRVEAASERMLAAERERTLRREREATTPAMRETDDPEDWRTSLLRITSPDGQGPEAGSEAAGRAGAERLQAQSQPASPVTPSQAASPMTPSQAASPVTPSQAASPRSWPTVTGTVTGTVGGDGEVQGLQPIRPRRRSSKEGAGAMQRVQAESRAAVQAVQASKEKEVAQVTVLLHQSQSRAKELEATALQESSARQ